MTATIASAITADQMDLLGHQVNSSAMRSWAFIETEEGDAELLVLFRQGGTVYRFAFRSWEDAQNWEDLRLADDLLQDGEDPISWGGALHRFRSNGALVPIAA